MTLCRLRSNTITSSSSACLLRFCSCPASLVDIQQVSESALYTVGRHISVVLDGGCRDVRRVLLSSFSRCMPSPLSHEGFQDVLSIIRYDGVFKRNVLQSSPAAWKGFSISSLPSTGDIRTSKVPRATISPRFREDSFPSSSRNRVSELSQMTCQHTS